MGVKKFLTNHLKINEHQHDSFYRSLRWKKIFKKKGKFSTSMHVLSDTDSYVYW